jgi:high-affinity Fe2+/Pb2+ permease
MQTMVLPTWASVALQFVLGFLVGAVLFWGFRQLWQSEFKIFAAVLAVVIVAALVLGVRWFRRKNDWTSLLVAGAVGLWVCFGPWVMLQFIG